MSLQSIFALITSIVCGAVGAYIFHPAIRATSLRQSSTIHSTEYQEEKDIIIYNPTMQSGSSLSSSPLEIINHDHILLSLIIPAYNEEKRLPAMLQHTLECIVNAQMEIIQLCHKALDSKSTISTNPTCNIIELIIVNDGSKDQTIHCTRQKISDHRMTLLGGPFHIRFITLTCNKGKGAAVQVGMLLSHGKLCLMLDADGATDFASGFHAVLEKMITMSSSSSSLKNNTTTNKEIGLYSVYGSRAHLQQQQHQSSHENTKIIQRSIVRTILMYGFHFFVRTLCSSKIQDTQCGFKLFTRPVAQILFSNLHLHRWAFDIELVVMSDILQIPVEEVSVNWQEIEGSKLATSKRALLFASIDMLRDMICVRLCYSLGIWKIHNK